MNLIKTHHSTLLTCICAALMSLLGFSCTSPEDVPDMYGTPTGDFEIKGAVTDEEGVEIPDAEIRVTHPDTSSGIFSLETTSTNEDGHYIAKGKAYADTELKVVCIPSDPGLEPDSVIVKMKYKDKDGPWYVGHAEEEVDFKLKKSK